MEGRGLLPSAGASKGRPYIKFDSMPVVHSWSISVDLQDRSQTITEPFRYISEARSGVSEPWERFAKIETAAQDFKVEER